MLKSASSPQRRLISLLVYSLTDLIFFRKNKKTIKNTANIVKALMAILFKIPDQPPDSPNDKYNNYY
jgi:hypothetical protein